MTTEIITKALEEHGAAVATMKDELTKGVKGVTARIEDLEQKMARRGGDIEPGSFGRKSSPVDSFIESKQLESLLGGANSTGRVVLSNGDLPSLRKALTSANVDVQPQRAPGLFNNPQIRLSLLDLLPVVPVNSSSFEFMSLVTAANGAAVQATEGSLKAESAPAFEVKTANIITIAHWVRASNQILSDAPALQNQLDNLLRYGVQAKLEAELMKGDGTTGHILGLELQATAYTPTATHASDRVGQAQTALQAAGWNPSVIVMHPTDWFAIASERAETGNGQYVLGSPRDPSGQNLWGLPVVTSPGITVGTALVMDTSQVALLDREQVTVMASREDRDNFVTNQTTILAEGRFGLAVFAPGAVLSVALNPTP
ncbi:phage major capsid protein, HK97 family [Stutzerimonas kunmingensis]|uniref:phage major capsid protein n=1 Tax=Stutzerimonas kunmingensis TaxID=1211807 RepID=UPI0008E2073E|nr:phage major capsid protein [Stutzerimonas kunmingensis]MCQ2042700.1 phage major capsid protein [Stutzerimonas kunmingensis]SFI76565.1 phage major capsid protein, HK97 family [Stutzerimonas kunmingensis]